MKLLPVFILGALLTANAYAITTEEITGLVSDGHWQQARQEIAAGLAQTNLDFPARQDLLFQSDRMQRMRWEFNQTRDQIFQQARAIVPTITEAEFTRWEKAGAVEFLEVDGTRQYYDRGAMNIFLINPEAKALKQKFSPDQGAISLYWLPGIRKVIADCDRTGARYSLPKTWRVTYTLSIPPGTVPAGETIRAWLPFPHAGNRQKNIRLISTDPAQFILADTNAALSSIYLEKTALSNQPVSFKIVFQYTSAAFFQPIDPLHVQPVATNDPALTPFLGEAPPQIIFTDDIKKLSAEIVGDETNDILKVRRIFAWVAQHITWSAAREYSTVVSLPEQALALGHGDCGMKTMTFMTLCRYNGIPARWETGWVVGADHDMHDWCEIYLAPYGWVPADVTYGLMDSRDEREKWFYLGGIDAGRLVLNTDYDQPLYPAKTFFRSEIVDFQRGEVEWRGGNLYFNQWNWNFDVVEIPAGNAGN